MVTCGDGRSSSSWFARSYCTSHDGSVVRKKGRKLLKMPFIRISVKTLRITWPSQASGLLWICQITKLELHLSLTQINVKFESA